MVNMIYDNGFLNIFDCCVMNKAEAAAKKAGGDAQTKETEAAPEPKVRR